MNNSLQMPRYGNFFARFFAAVIDNFLATMLAVIGAGLVGLFGMLFGMASTRSGEGGFLGGIFSMLLFAWPVSVIAFVGYFVKFETGVGQATLGKKMLGLKVVSLDGGRVTVGQSLGRFLVKWLISDLFFMVGYLMAAFSERKQALHDMAASTLVVEAR